MLRGPEIFQHGGGHAQGAGTVPNLIEDRPGRPAVSMVGNLADEGSGAGDRQNSVEVLHGPVGHDRGGYQEHELVESRGPRSPRRGQQQLALFPGGELGSSMVGFQPDLPDLGHQVEGVPHVVEHGEHEFDILPRVSLLVGGRWPEPDEAGDQSKWLAPCFHPGLEWYGKGADQVVKELPAEPGGVQHQGIGIVVGADAGFLGDGGRVPRFEHVSRDTESCSIHDRFRIEDRQVGKHAFANQSTIVPAP